MIDTKTKTRLFEELEQMELLAAKTTYDGIDYNARSDGAFQMLQILGLSKEYIEWAYKRSEEV